jgi:hypothetical protein
MSPFGSQSPPNRKEHIGGGKGTGKGWGHGPEKESPQVAAHIDKAPKTHSNPRGGEKYGGVGQMSKKPGGGGTMPSSLGRTGGAGPSGDSRNITTKTSAGGWSGPIKTLKAGMQSALTERTRRQARGG